MSTKGLSWGPFSVQLDYDYTPAVRALEISKGGRLLAERILRDRSRIEETLTRIAVFREDMGRIPANAVEEDPEQPYWTNGWLPAVDAAMLYSLVASHRPSVYLEVGSGNSTKFVRRAIRDHSLATRIISIDPCPRAEVDAICDEVIRSPIENVDIDNVAARLKSGDVVFVDNSHRGFQNSDVTVCFMELMPALPSGVCFGVHDIYLPYDYDPCHLDYFYNEQYYLGMYLLGGAVNDKIIMPAWYSCREPALAPHVVTALDHPGIPHSTLSGSSFWMEFGARVPTNGE